MIVFFLRKIARGRTGRRSTGPTGRGWPGPGGVAGAAALPGQGGQAGGAGELVEACPVLRNRWSRLRPHLGQGQCFSWCLWS